MSGWIKLHRSLLDWEWYSDNNTKIVFLHLLLTANHEEKEWCGITVKRGEIVTSIAKLSGELGLTQKQIRRCLDVLKSCKTVGTVEGSEKGTEQGTKRARKGTHLSICNYNNYQGSVEARGHEKGTEQGTERARSRATTKEVKKERSKETTIVDGYSETFEKFWEIYGRKGNKRKSFAQWKKLSESQIEEIRGKVLPYLKSTSGERFQWRKNAETYLNPHNEHWNDAIVTEIPSTKKIETVAPMKNTGIFA